MREESSVESNRTALTEKSVIGGTMILSMDFEMNVRLVNNCVASR